MVALLSLATQGCQLFIHRLFQPVFFPNEKNGRAKKEREKRRGKKSLVETGEAQRLKETFEIRKRQTGIC